MNRIIGICILALLLLGCGNSERKESAEVEDSVDAEDKAMQSPKANAKAVLPIYNFSEFEKKYLKKETDSTYVINFWATWCKPCVKELPEFEKLNATYSDEKVKVILVSLDFPDKIEQQVIPFIEKNNLQSKVILLDDPDANSWIPKISEEWSGAIPATLFLKGDNKKFFEKSFTFSELEKEIKSI